MSNVFDNNIKVDASGNATISGNLTVNGATTTINSTTLTVDDKVIVIASGAADSAAADGAGISVDGAAATILYDHTGTQWEMNKPLEVTGALSSTAAVTVGTDLIVTGGDITYGNGQDATASITATAHNAAGKSLTIAAGTTTAGTTNNIAGGSVTIKAGQGKGSGAGGDIVFQTANAGGSGSSLNALATALTISDDLSATFVGTITVPESSLILGSTAVTSTAAELNLLDNVSGLVQADFTKLAAIDASAAEINAACDATARVAAAVVVADDHFLFADGGATGATKVESIADLMTAVAGTVATTGLTASSGTLVVSDLHPVGVSGSANQMITDDGDGTVTSQANLSFDGSTLAVTGALSTTTTAVVGTNTTVGTAGNTTGVSISTVTNTGTNVGKALTIAGGDTTVGSNNLNGGDLVLKTGGGDGTGTAAMTFHTKISGTDAAGERMRIHTDGNIGMGDNAPGTLLQMKGTAPYITLQNSTAENSEGGCEGRILFEDHGNNPLAQVEGSHTGTADDEKGQLTFSTNNDSGLQAGMTINDTQQVIIGAGKLVLGSTAVTSSAAELNYADGVTSAIQTQLDGKSPVAGHSSIATVGTIGTGTWQGTAVASAYLDADTAHLSGAQTFTGTKTLNSFKGTGAITVTNILDEDAMGTNSDTALATQQSIKAYADTKSPVAGHSSIVTTGTIGTGVWQGTAVASAYLDADTAHLSGTQTFSGAKTFSADVVISGTTPQLTIGDAGAEDTLLVFDGNAQDYRIGIDDGTDTLEIGVGAAHGTTPAIVVAPDAGVKVMGTLEINASIADEAASGVISIFTAGEALVRGEVVYFKAGDSKMWKAVATAAATSRCVAMAAEDLAADAVGKFLLQGFLRDNGSFPAYTIAGALYTPEAETSSQNVPEQAAPATDGDFVQVLGWAVTADMVYFNPSNDIIEVA
jgi:fibronectin-binding autotransporter adhesin